MSLSAHVESALCHLLANRPVAWESLSADDWASLPSQAAANGLGAVVYQHWQTQGWPPALPTAVRTALAQHYYNTVAQTTLYLAELGRLLRAWQSALPPLPNGQPPLLLLKGAALATTVYADPALRPMGDLDILVPEAHLTTALLIAQKLGYMAATAEAHTGIRALVEHAVDLRRGPVALELHWQLIVGAADVRAPDLQWFWANTLPWQQRSAQAQQLNPTAQVLYLAAHLGIQHAAPPRRLIWFYDLHLVLQQHAAAIDWETLWAQATAWQWLPAVTATLRELQAQLGTPLPTSVSARLAAYTPPASVPAPTRLALTWQKLATLHGTARWRLALSLLWPSPAYMRWRYHPHPAWLWPLCYVWRWWDVGRELAHTLQIARTQKSI